MKKESTAKLLRAVAFLLCVALLLVLLTGLCERKTYWGAWNYMAKVNEFYAMESNSLDYICVGSSHMYCSLNPLEVWAQTGAAGFVLATQQQPLLASYYYIKEALKTQSPKVVVVEGWMGCMEDKHESAVLYDAIDPLKPSLDKLRMIRDLVPEGERKAYYFNLIKYHSRWREMTFSEICTYFKSLFTTPTDIYKGFVALDGDYAGQNILPDYSAVETVQLSQYNLEILSNMKKLVEANGGEMVLMFAPYGPITQEHLAIMKAERLWATKNGVAILDYAAMLDELSIDPVQDYYDSGHLDVSGAAKISQHFAAWLAEKGISNTSNVNFEKWQTDYNTYLDAFFADLSA